MLGGWQCLILCVAVFGGVTNGRVPVKRSHFDGCTTAGGNKCVKNAVCIISQLSFTQLSFTCICNPGYTGDGQIICKGKQTK